MTGEKVGDDELVARFVTQSNWIRRNTNPPSVKPDAFIPHPGKETSVTRHDDLTAEQLWQIGSDIAAARDITLHGRADASTKLIRSNKLDVNSDPIQGNRNHAVIVGWAESDKPRQKIQAQKIAAEASFAAKP